MKRQNDVLGSWIADINKTHDERMKERRNDTDLFAFGQTQSGIHPGRKNGTRRAPPRTKVRMEGYIGSILEVKDMRGDPDSKGTRFSMQPRLPMPPTHTESEGSSVVHTSMDERLTQPANAHQMLNGIAKTDRYRKALRAITTTSISWDQDTTSIHSTSRERIDSLLREYNGSSIDVPDLSAQDKTKIARRARCPRYKVKFVVHENVTNASGGGHTLAKTCMVGFFDDMPETGEYYVFMCFKQTNAANRSVLQMFQYTIQEQEMGVEITPLWMTHVAELLLGPEFNGITVARFFLAYKMDMTAAVSLIDYNVPWHREKWFHDVFCASPILRRYFIKEMAAFVPDKAREAMRQLAPARLFEMLCLVHAEPVHLCFSWNWPSDLQVDAMFGKHMAEHNATANFEMTADGFMAMFACTHYPTSATPLSASDIEIYREIFARHSIVAADRGSDPHRDDGLYTTMTTLMASGIVHTHDACALASSSSGTALFYTKGYFMDSTLFTNSLRILLHMPGPDLGTLVGLEGLRDHQRRVADDVRTHSLVVVDGGSGSGKTWLGINLPRMFSRAARWICVSPTVQPGMLHLNTLFFAMNRYSSAFGTVMAKARAILYTSERQGIRFEFTKAERDVGIGGADAVEFLKMYFAAHGGDAARTAEQYVAIILNMAFHGDIDLTTLREFCQYCTLRRTEIAVVDHASLVSMQHVNHLFLCLPGIKKMVVLGDRCRTPILGDSNAGNRAMLGCFDVLCALASDKAAVHQWPSGDASVESAAEQGNNSDQAAAVHHDVATLTIKILLTKLCGVQGPRTRVLVEGDAEKAEIDRVLCDLTKKNDVDSGVLRTGDSITFLQYHPGAPRFRFCPFGSDMVVPGLSDTIDHIIDHDHIQEDPVFRSSTADAKRTPTTRRFLVLRNTHKIVCLNEYSSHAIHHNNLAVTLENAPFHGMSHDCSTTVVIVNRSVGQEHQIRRYLYEALAAVTDHVYIVQVNAAKEESWDVVHKDKMDEIYTALRNVQEHELHTAFLLAKMKLCLG